MNQVALVGRITRDPSFVGTGATPRCNFSVAVDRPYIKDKEKATDFFDCVAWGKTAEFVGKYLEKGRLVAVTGRIEINVVTINRNSASLVVTGASGSWGCILYSCDERGQFGLRFVCSDFGL